MGVRPQIIVVSSVLTSVLTVLNLFLTQTAGFNKDEVIAKLISNYSTDLYPNYKTGEPIHVRVTVNIISIDSISQSDMNLSVTVSIRQSWFDERLNFSYLENATRLEFDPKFTDEIWKPDLVFYNELVSYMHSVTVTNQLLHVFPNGFIIYALKITLTISCEMDMRKFPFDDQVCYMIMESYNYSNTTLQFVWAKKTPVLYSRDIQLPEFKLTGINAINVEAAYYIGVWSGVRMDILLRRTFGYYITQVFIPTSLVVILSWLTFWLDVDSVPARVSLGILTIVTMITQSTDARSYLPRVSYIKAIDVWLSMCQLFVIGAIFEFAIVNLMARNEDWFTMKGNFAGYIPLTKLFTKAKTDKSGHERVSPYAVDTKTAKKSQDRAVRVDKISRLAFPILFTILNICYWTFYYTWKVDPILPRVHSIRDAQ